MTTAILGQQDRERAEKWFNVYPDDIGAKELLKIVKEGEIEVKEVKL